jgi:hypothetical protein
MNEGQENYISVVDPIGPAIEHTKNVLFRPFDIGRWFVIGLGAWLAQLGSGGGPNFNLPGNGGGGGGGSGLKEALDEIYINLYWIVPLAIVIFILIIVIWLLIFWLSSRGKFMLLHCVATNRAEVKYPWRQYRTQANSLFKFNICIALLTIPAFLIPIAIGILLIIPSAEAENVFLAVIIGIILVFTLIAFGIIFGLIMFFTYTIVVPIMYLRGCRVRQAWREFWNLASFNKGRFILLALFHFVINIAIGSIVLATACITCGCACCLYAIPYIGTVILLPLHVFTRSYSLFYLRQYGLEYDVFALEPPPQEQPYIKNPPNPGNYL